MNRPGWLTRRAPALALAALATTACNKKETEAAKDAPPHVAASTVTATVEPFTRTISAIGTVVARPGHYAALSAPSATRIIKVNVAPGDRVAAGSPLVEFDQSQFGSLANAAEAALTAAQRNSDRAHRLADEGILPRKDAEQAAADLGKAKADAVAAQRALQLSVLRSPVNGVVTNMKAVLGASADAGQVLVEVADPSAFDVVLSLGATEAGSILPGARVALHAGDKGGDELGDGRVMSVGATVDTASRAVSIRVAVATPRRALRLGESVYGEIALSTRSSVTIPAAALLPGDEVGTFKVFVVDAKGVATSREVKIGGRNDAKVEIVDGLKGGEKIVTQGAFAVQDSAHVGKEVPVKAGAKTDDEKP